MPHAYIIIDFARRYSETRKEKHNYGKRTGTGPPGSSNEKNTKESEANIIVLFIYLYK
jgi:hypothetical protein